MRRPANAVINGPYGQGSLMTIAYAVNRWLQNFGIQIVRTVTVDRLQSVPAHQVAHVAVPGPTCAPTLHRTPDLVPTAILSQKTAAFDASVPTDWKDPISVLRKKWGEIPAGDRRRSSAQLLQLTDQEILTEWERARKNDTRGLGFGVRGWYHEAYRSLMPGKKVLDIGCGMALSTLSFAEMGAHVTFADIIPDNVELVRRLCRIKGIPGEFVAIERFEDIDQLPTFDIVAAIGSLINAPLAVTRAEVERLKMHLQPGGRWLHLAYPKSRWEQEGSVPFSEWGKRTDGPGTPWMEYHDRERIFWLFEPSEIRILFECEWQRHSYNWFDIELLHH